MYVAVREMAVVPRTARIPATSDDFGRKKRVGDDFSASQKFNTRKVANLMFLKRRLQ